MPLAWCFRSMGGACAYRVSDGRQDFSCLHCQVTLQMMQSQRYAAHDQTACQFCKQSKNLRTKEWGRPRENNALLGQKYVNDIAIQITQERRMLIRCSWSSLVSRLHYHMTLAKALCNADLPYFCDLRCQL